MTPVQPFIASGSPVRLMLLCLLSLMFVALGVGMIVRGAGNAELLLLWVAAVLLFGAAAIALLVRVMRTGPEVRVDANGIWLRRTARNTIPWSAIRDMSVTKVRRQRFLCLGLVDPGLIRSSGMAADANKALGFGDVSIGVTGTDRSFDDLIAAVRAFAPPHLRV